MPRRSTRIDVTRDTKINIESRVFLSTDYPGSPNLPADIAKLPIYTTYGNTLGLTQRFNHLELSAKASYRPDQIPGLRAHRRRQPRATTIATSPSTAGRCARATRCSRASSRSPRSAPTRASTICNSTATASSATRRRSRRRVGTTFEITRKLTGEVSVGYLTRHYQDPTLLDLRGLVFDASLKWEATGLTTATLTATSRADESVVAGWSGALRRDVGVQVDHALRRWLIWTVKAGYGFDEYVSDPALHGRGAQDNGCRSAPR